jgi:hypothetical protein
VANPVIIDRPDLSVTVPPTPAGTSGLIPVGYSTSIIQEAVESSMALASFRRVNMPNGAQVLPVLDVLPVAKWVTGEPSSGGSQAGKKSVTQQQWKGINLIAEEIAVIVVIPEAVIEDASIDLWAEVTPRLGEAIGYAIDSAVFAGTNKPASWPAAIIPAATAAGHVATGSGTIPDQTDFNEAMGFVEMDGYMPSDVYSAVAMRAGFRGWTINGIPVYLSDFRDDGRVDSVYGLTIRYDRTGALGTAANKTYAVVGDASYAILGVRTDLQYKVLTEATLDVSAAGDGSELVSLAQQDMVGLRVRGRFAFAVANPVTYLQPASASRYPFAAVKGA